jgi:hypothetical protein
MAVIIPAPDHEFGKVAQLLLAIAGPDRVDEVRTGTLPARFEVPDDVAEQYEQLFSRVRAASEQSVKPGKRAGRKAAVPTSDTRETS